MVGSEIAFRGFLGRGLFAFFVQASRRIDLELDSRIDRHASLTTILSTASATESTATLSTATLSTATESSLSTTATAESAASATASATAASATAPTPTTTTELRECDRPVRLTLDDG